MDLASFALNKRVISALSTILILAAGLYAYTALPKFEDPEFVIRQAQIITPYPGASAEEVADEVTDAIEAALQQLTGVDEIRSNSQPGRSTVNIEFTIPAARTREDLAQRFNEMRAKIGDMQAELPPGALPSLIFDDFGDIYAQYYAITGEGFSLPELYAYAKELERELVLVDGVSKVSLIGMQDEVIYVEFATARLIQLGLVPDQIADVLEGQNLVTPAGSIKAGEMRLRVRATGAVDSIRAIENLVIANPNTGKSYRLADIADVSRGLVDPATHLLFRNGQPAIGLGVSNVIGGNVVTMADALRARMAELLDQRPIGIDVEAISDQGASVRESVNSFVMNVVLALVIVVGTLLVFMGLRSGILMGGILLVTIAGTLFGMLLYGLDMQRISLGALIIALGMLVDNAIVVVEGTLVRVQRGESPAKASVAIVNQTKWPLLGGTVVGFLAFSPIGFSPDATGEYAGSLFWTVMIALLFSWLVAVWLTPWFCVLMLKPGKIETKGENLFFRSYRRLLGLAIRWRYATVAIVLALFGSALAMQSMVPPGFFPASTRTQFVIDYFLPDGTDIETTRADILHISEYVRGLDGVTATNTSVGKGHLRFMLTYSAEDANPAYGQILVDVEEYRQIDALQVHMQEWVQENMPQANSKVWKFMLGPGGGSIVEARFFGPDPVVLPVVGAGETDHDRRGRGGGQGRLARTGAGAAPGDRHRERPASGPDPGRDFGCRAGASGRHAHRRLPRRGRAARHHHAPGIMRPVEADRRDIASLQDIKVFSQLIGAYIPIAQLVHRFDLVFEAGNLRRLDRKLMITAQSDNAPGVLSGDLFAQVRGPIEAIELPPGYTLEWRGEFGNSQEANEGLAMTMPIGFGAMIIVVILLFNAVRQPLIIWATVPLALIGVIWGLALSGTPMEFMAILGILSLTGMLIKNAIVLIDETDSQIGTGKARMSAVIDSAVSRVRPVSLGVLTTVPGVVPLLWDPFFKSLAVVIICGLSFATILTLIVVPVLYAIFFGVTQDETGPEIGPEIDPDAEQTAAG